MVGFVLLVLSVAPPMQRRANGKMESVGGVALRLSGRSCASLADEAVRVAIDLNL
jgi:hypothetical protein